MRDTRASTMNRRTLAIGVAAVVGAAVLYIASPLASEARLIGSFMMHFASGDLMPCSCSLCTGGI